MIVQSIGLIEDPIIIIIYDESIFSVNNGPQKV